MVREKKAKDAALLTAALIVALSFVYIPDWYLVGICRQSHPAVRLVYSFFHSSPLHAVINAWCLLSVVFLYNISHRRLLAAYIAAVLVPGFLLSESPTVGLSCICYFLLGSILFEVRRKLWFTCCMVGYMVVGFLIPSVNAVIHIYGYLAGLIVGLLNAPLSCLTRRK